jgi:nitrogen fixation protein FixH
MKSLKFGFVILASTGLLFLGACSAGNQESASTEKTEVAKTTTDTTSKTETPKSDVAEKKEVDKHEEGKEHSHGGQVVKSGQYHLELIAEKAEKETHLHLHMEKGEKQEPITNAKVTAQLQLPDGTQKNLDLKYDAKEKNYTNILPGNVPGQYQMKVTADVGGEKVNGRFNFNQ